MHLSFVLLIIVAVTSPGEMKTMEELEKEVNFLKMIVVSRFENIEAKIEQIEAKTKKIETKTENIKTKTENTEAKTENIEAKTKNIKTKTENTEAKTENIEAKTKKIEAKTKKIETKTENIKTKTENTEAKTENIEAKTKKIEAKTKNIDAKIENIQARTENTEAITKNIKQKIENKDGNNQILIEYSVNRFDIIEESIAKVDEVIATNTIDINANDEDTAKINDENTANEGRITKLEDDVMNLVMRSSFCGYQGWWCTDNSMITYSKLMVVDNNIAESSFSATTGRFTAGIAGVYRVDLGIGYILSSRSEYNAIYINLNGVNIGESNIYSHIYDTTTSYENGARSLLLNMEKNDYLGVYVTTVYGLYHITFCVSLDTVSA